MNAKQLAKNMLVENRDYIEDAIEGAPLGNSVVGSILSLTHNIPRQYAEAAVIDALNEIEDESLPGREG